MCLHGSVPCTLNCRAEMHEQEHQICLICQSIAVLTSAVDHALMSQQGQYDSLGFILTSVTAQATQCHWTLLSTLPEVVT